MKDYTPRPNICTQIYETLVDILKHLLDLFLTSKSFCWILKHALLIYIFMRTCSFNILNISIFISLQYLCLKVSCHPNTPMDIAWSLLTAWFSRAMPIWWYFKILFLLTSWTHTTFLCKYLFWYHIIPCTLSCGTYIMSVSDASLMLGL